MAANADGCPKSGEACYRSSMAKKRRTDDPIPKAEAERQRDAVLRRMLTTPPKTHSGVEKPGPVPRKRKKLRLAKRKDD